MNTINDYFGFLPINKTIEWNYGSATPTHDFDRMILNIKEHVNADGYIYPPSIAEYIAESPESTKDSWTEIQKTSRPALLHKLPISHQIKLTYGENNSKEEFRNNDGAFLMQFIGFLFGYRLQFRDWWHDGRIFMKGRRWSILKPGTESKFISKAYETWLAWKRTEQTRFTNILFMHNRSDHYEWDWEKFNINYMVFDACYKMFEEIQGSKKFRHRERFDGLLEFYNIQFIRDHVDQIISLRNNLFHETIWDGGQPCSGKNNGWVQADNLKRINDRAILAIAGCRTSYINSNWATIGQHLIE
jgi:hypothetical protein